MSTLITPDEFEGVIRLFGPPKKVRIEYKGPNKNQDVQLALPNSSQASMAVVLDHVDSKCLLDLYRKSFDDRGRYVGVIRMDDGSLRTDIDSQISATRLKMLAARWGTQTPLVVLTPEVITARKIGQGSWYLDELVVLMGRKGINSAQYHEKRDYERFHGMWGDR